ncbi:MAG: YheU family protein [Pseudomonadota bacterium]
MDRGTIIPWRELSSEALNGLVEEFVSREGTEYGEEEVSLADKVREVMTQLEAGTVVVVFDVEGGSASVVPAHDLPGS